MFRMNFPRRFTSRPDFRLWPPPRNRPLNYRRQYARPVSCDPPSPPPCFFHAARFHLQDYYRSSQRQSANRETPDGVERLRGCAKSESVWDLDNRAADATPGFSLFSSSRWKMLFTRFLPSFDTILQFDIICSWEWWISGDPNINGIDQLPPKILQLEMV